MVRDISEICEKTGVEASWLLAQCTSDLSKLDYVQPPLAAFDIANVGLHPAKLLRKLHLGNALRTPYVAKRINEPPVLFCEYCLRHGRPSSPLAKSLYADIEYAVFEYCGEFDAPIPDASRTLRPSRWMWASARSGGTDDKFRGRDGQGDGPAGSRSGHV